jgi:hypothetical protein
VVPNSQGLDLSAQPAPESPVVSSNSSLFAKENQEQTPGLSESLSRWVRKVQDSAVKRSSSRSRGSLKVIEPIAPSPVASRTRTSLKRAASFSGDEDFPSRVCDHDKDRTSLSLRKALAKRISSEDPQLKKGKRDLEE